MTTLRKILESEEGEILTSDIVIMAKKLGVDLKPSKNKRRAHHIDKVKGIVTITQFQIQFGLDEEF